MYINENFIYISLDIIIIIVFSIYYIRQFNMEGIFMSIFKTPDDQKKMFDKSISESLNKLFLMDIYVTITSYKLLTPIKAVIIDYSNNILSLRPNDSQATKKFTSGDPVVIHLSSEDILYNANASILTNYNLTMDVIIEKVLSQKDIRREKRFLVSFSGEITYQNEKSFIVLKNISMQGLNFISKLDLPLNAKIDITFTTYDFTKISFVASIVHKNSLINGYSYGAFIVNIDANNLKKMDYCLHNLQ